MAYQISWSEGAIDDLAAIAAYIEIDSPAHAASVVTRIVDEVADLPRFPRANRKVPEYDHELICQRVVFSYRAIYRIKDEERSIEILAVVHGARILPEEVRDRIGD